MASKNLNLALLLTYLKQSLLQVTIKAADIRFIWFYILFV